MKPRNAIQREVAALSALIPPITEAQKRWAVEHVGTGEAYLCKGEAWCTACGGTFDAPTVSPLGAELCGEAVVCPHCGRRLKLKNSQSKKVLDKCYYTIVTTFHGWQVCRNFSVERYTRKGEEAWVDVDEVVQNWIAEDGHEEVIARPINTYHGCLDSWDTSKPMALRDCKRKDMLRPDKYYIGGAWIYPHRRVLPTAKRNGYTGRNNTGIAESEHIRLLLTDREAEVLEKNGQYALLEWKRARGYREFCLPYSHSIRVANRNKYRVKDPSMWMDYLYLLEYFHLDTHNARYVCPSDLKAAHDRLHLRKQRVEERKAAERRRMEAAKYEATYRAQKGAYLGICFGNEEIRISVLRSVAEFAEEGAAMHHCVFSACYYKRPDALILSAKSAEGQRIATVELSLRTLKIVQCRGKCNAKPEHYDEIIQLINTNIHLFKKSVK